VHFIETQVFTKQITSLLDDADYRQLQVVLALKPRAGDIIRGSGGLRKIRWSTREKQTGGSRQQPAASTPQSSEGGIQMNDKMFAELVESIKQAGQIRRGTKRAVRRTTIGAPDVQDIRSRLGLSQAQFAMMIGVSPRTVQNWEQKRREPEGAAKALLMVTARHPRVVLEALHAA
jgi:putative transcriptional regulator